MKQQDLPALIIDNRHKPVVLADAEHIVRYINEPTDKFELILDTAGVCGSSAHAKKED